MPVLPLPLIRLSNAGILRPPRRTQNEGHWGFPPRTTNRGYPTSFEGVQAGLYPGEKESRHGGLGEATGRPKKMQATCLMDHKWRYNENLCTPQSWGCLVLGPSADS